MADKETAAQRKAREARENDPAMQVHGNPREGLMKQIEEEGLDPSIVDLGTGQTGPRGDSFVNPALIGSGTILPGGQGYGAPLPDPNVKRLQETTSMDLEFPDSLPPDDETRQAAK